MHAQLFIDDDAARTAVAVARLAYQKAEVIRLAAVAVDEAATAAKGVADDLKAAVLSTSVTPLKLAAAAALAAATEHIVHERAELAQLECLGNRVI